MTALIVISIIFSSLLFLVNLADMSSGVGETPNHAIHMIFLAVIIVTLSFCLA